VLGLKDAPQMAARDAQVAREALDAGLGVLAAVQPFGGLLGQGARGIRRRPGQRPWRQLGAAFHAGPKALGLGLRRGREEAAVLTPRQAHAADRAAVDAGRSDANIEPPVEARVMRLQRGVGGIGGQKGKGHAASLGAGRCRSWPFSDICLRAWRAAQGR